MATVWAIAVPALTTSIEGQRLGMETGAVERELPIARMSDVQFFFFQAEDGIRDYKVTGVQTCALPIFHERPDDRLELAELQPIVGSLVNASAVRRVFEMTRMLSRARVFRLSPGGSPEATDRKSVV